MLIIQSTEYFCRHIETLGTALTWFNFVCLRFTMLHLADHATTSPRHRDLLIWTYRSAEVARNRHFLGRKGQFVVDSIWGTIDEVIPGLQALMLAEDGQNSTQANTEEAELVYSHHRHGESALYEEYNTFGSRFQWQQHELSFGERTSTSHENRRKSPSDFSATGPHYIIADTFEESQWEELRREGSVDSDIDENTQEISLEDMSPYIDPALIDPDLELCDTNFLPVVQIGPQNTLLARQILQRQPLQCQ